MALQLLRAVVASDTLGNPSSFLQGSTVAGRFSLPPTAEPHLYSSQELPPLFPRLLSPQGLPSSYLLGGPHVSVMPLLKRHSLRDASADLCLKHCSDSIFPARLLVLRSYFLLFITCHFFNCYNLPVDHVYSFLLSGIFGSLM